MSDMDPGVEMFSPEPILKKDRNTNNSEERATNASDKTALSAKDDELISMETLRDSPVQWPEPLPGMDDFVTMSQTPIHTPNADHTQNLSNVDMARINELATLTPEQLIEKIKSMHDEIYQLGLRESKEMTRGKLLGIFNRLSKGKK